MRGRLTSDLTILELLKAVVRDVIVNLDEYQLIRACGHFEAASRPSSTLKAVLLNKLIEYEHNNWYIKLKGNILVYC